MENDLDDDPEAAMRAMMGFSSFTTRPKNQPGNTTTQFSVEQAVVGAPHATGANAQAVNPAREVVDDPVPSEYQSDHLPQQQQRPSTNPRNQNSQPLAAFTAPKTGMSFTHAELEQWAQGKVNERGDTVYFKPGFVEDDPWAKLRNGGWGRSDNAVGGVGFDRKRKGGRGR